MKKMTLIVDLLIKYIKKIIIIIEQMSKFNPLGDQIPLDNKMKPLKLFKNGGQQVPALSPYHSAFPHTSSKKIINMKKQYRVHENVNDNQSQSRSYSQISQQQQTNSFIKTQKSVQLHERLKNLHVFYKNKIQEEKNQTAQRNNVFLGIIQEMQRNHQLKVAQLKKMIDDSEGEKRDVGLVDDRMNQIKGSIDEILKQSSELKVSNQKLQRQINQKQHALREKQEQLSKLKEELMEQRTQLQSFERLNLKQNKRNKQIVGMIDKTAQSTNKQY